MQNAKRGEESPTRVAIALGSNVGDRRAHLEHAVTRLVEHLSDVTASAFHETRAVTPDSQPDFLNAAVIGATTLPPRELLDVLLRIEQERGRERTRAMAPRTLDLDLILYGQRIVEEPGLQVPHPRFRERLFVLAPLAEVAPDWIDPITGMKVRELCARLPTPSLLPSSPLPAPGPALANAARL